MKHLQFTGEKFVGVVDLGDEGYDRAEELAGDSLTFMAVAVNNNWKVPLGYFFISSLNAAGMCLKSYKGRHKKTSTFYGHVRKTGEKGGGVRWFTNLSVKSVFF